VPFALLATAYRRKRIMEGLISGDKDMTAQVGTLWAGNMVNLLSCRACWIGSAVAVMVLIIKAAVLPVACCALAAPACLWLVTAVAT
jgi:hypothetical protein